MTLLPAQLRVLGVLRQFGPTTKSDLRTHTLTLASLKRLGLITAGENAPTAYSITPRGIEAVTNGEI